MADLPKAERLQQLEHRILVLNGGTLDQPNHVARELLGYIRALESELADYYKAEEALYGKNSRGKFLEDAGTRASPRPEPERRDEVADQPAPTGPDCEYCGAGADEPCDRGVHHGPTEPAPKNSSEQRNRS